MSLYDSQARAGSLLGVDGILVVLFSIPMIHDKFLVTSKMDVKPCICIDKKNR